MLAQRPTFFLHTHHWYFASHAIFVMDNYAIADQFSLLSKLMDIHGENSFKAKNYASAAFAIERLPQQLAGLPEEKIVGYKGIGDSTGKKIVELLATGELKVLQELIAKTPAGVLEIMNVKGLGPKKIHTLWKEMSIDAIDVLEEACRTNRIANTKGFGERTQQKILESIAFVRSSEGKFLYKQVEDFTLALQQKLEQKFSGEQITISGEFRRQLEIISRLDWVTTAGGEELKIFLVNEQISLIQESDEELVFSAEGLVNLHFHLATKTAYARRLLEGSCSGEFLLGWKHLSKTETAATEEELFKASGLPFIPSYLREEVSTLEQIKTKDLSAIVETSSIKGLIHSHSTWSDGAYTIGQMAEELIRTGFEYLVISDHSKAAAYASGLSEEKIVQQHQHIDELNKKLAPFKIFKSIECDILGDGQLDYSNEVLSSFDLVITSIHSNLDMEEDKAMMRLLAAINNPHTTILGHMTGRLLLKRKAYPIDHKTIIDACAKNNVVIEINASPHRLDMDWRWIDYALEKGLLLSINPDAHSLEEFTYIKYGTLVAQKGGLPVSKNLSSFSLKEFEDFLQENRKRRVGSKEPQNR